MFFKRWAEQFSDDLAIDLGTANTLVFVRGEGIVLNEPSVVAIHEPGGSLIVDIGGGTTEVAVISLAGVIYCKSVRIAGDQMDEAIRQHIRKHYNLLIGERRAEEIKINLGSAYPGEGEPRTMEVKGRDLVDGFPKTVVLTEDEVREALGDAVMAIVATVRTCLELKPLELAADIVDTGIVITGGGGLLRGLDRLLGQESQLPVTVAKDPMSCVALGIGRVLDELELLKKVATPA